MLILLSPSKKLDETSKLSGTVSPVQPRFLEDAETLVAGLKKLDEVALGKLMKLSDKLAQLNYERYQNFQTPFTPHNARPALFTFKGDVYDNMDVAAYKIEELEFAQKHVRILSGLYGILRPLDLMQPYRLEMGTSYPTPRGKDLYAFWGAKITDLLKRRYDGGPIVNLASQEYAKVIDFSKLNQVITIDFKHLKEGKVKTIGLLAKRARGRMTDFAIKHKIVDAEKLKNFAEDGYVFEDSMSDANTWTFVKDVT